MVQSVKGTVAPTNNKKRKADGHQEAIEVAAIAEEAHSETDARLTKQQK